VYENVLTLCSQIQYQTMKSMAFPLEPLRKKPCYALGRALPSNDYFRPQPRRTSAKDSGMDVYPIRIPETMAFLMEEKGNE
jgi:hypothetical protein